MTKILNFALKIKGVGGRVTHVKSSDLATPQNLEHVQKDLTCVCLLGQSWFT